MYLIDGEPETKHNDAQNSSDSENEERIETESENKEKETGIENEETGIENEETGTEDKEVEGEDIEIEREEMENEAVTSESTRVKAPSEFVFCYSYQTPPIQPMFRRTISSTMRPSSNFQTQLDPVVLWSSSQQIKMGGLFRATGMMKTPGWSILPK